jgi:putative molybdopterin biosynthesis protein
MDENVSYTIEEIAKILRVSKLTVYDLVKKNELPTYRVGRQMRVDQQDLERYKSKTKTGISHQDVNASKMHTDLEINPQNQIIISGQDVVLDMLSKYIETHSSFIPLRLYTGSLNSLISMYNGECDVVSVHLYDADSGEYNLPYVKRILVSQPFILVNLVCRNAGIYVRQGNPHQIKSWGDLVHAGITFVNREKGSGARILLDEQLRLNGIRTDKLIGYDKELTSHFSVASAVASGQADAGVGIENVTKMVDVDFVPLMKERYDLVVLKTKQNQSLVEIVKEAVGSPEYRSQLEQLYGYDLELTGKILFES